MLLRFVLFLEFALLYDHVKTIWIQKLTRINVCNVYKSIKHFYEAKQYELLQNAVPLDIFQQLTDDFKKVVLMR